MLSSHLLEKSLKIVARGAGAGGGVHVFLSKKRNSSYFLYISYLTKLKSKIGTAIGEKREFLMLVPYIGTFICVQ